MPHLDDETLDDILYLARTNDSQELLPLLKALSTKHNTPTITLVLDAADPDTGNTALHYAAANGHSLLLAALLQLDPTNASARRALVAHANHAGSTALHYAAANGQLDAVRTLAAARLPVFRVPAASQNAQEGESDKPPPDDGLDADLGAEDRQTQTDFLEQRNQAGRDAAAEAEAAGKENVVGWLLGALDRLEPDSGEGAAEGKAEEGDVEAADLADEVEGVGLESGSR